MRRSREAAERLRKLEEQVDRMSRVVDRIEVATIVREPSSGLAADAYNGLRKQVVAAASHRTAHLHQLALFANAVEDGQVDGIASLVKEWMAQADLVRMDDASDERYFDVLGGDGDALRVLRPAYIDAATGRAIVMGQAERTAAVEDSAPTADHEVAR
ncbi:hypothetical protein ACFQV2_03535 [Actinokineospora soli]|uniref:Uncharacterized protein n=1 Tax=Actinokineospora soli TaxID=1048753 RepID=A0ABW2TGS4_9PSEU